MSNLTADQRSRERERQRRYGTEKIEDIPRFSEPRKITERQDSLSNKIQNVLGDMGAVQKVIELSPNVWLGTSRNASSSKTYPGSGGNSQSQKEEKIKSSVSSTSHSDLNLKLPTSKLAHPSKFRENTSPSSDNCDSKQSETSRWQDLNRKSAMNRARLQSMDMPAAMEKIFIDMRMNEEEPISAIQTPLVQDLKKHELLSKIAMASNRRRDESRKNSGSRAFADATPQEDIQYCNDSESSEDDDSDSDESEKAERTSQWDLYGIMNETDSNSSKRIPDNSSQFESLDKKQSTAQEELTSVVSKDNRKMKKRSRGRPAISMHTDKVSSSQTPLSQRQYSSPDSSSDSSEETNEKHFAHCENSPLDCSQASMLAGQHRDTKNSPKSSVVSTTSSLSEDESTFSDGSFHDHTSKQSDYYARKTSSRQGEAISSSQSLVTSNNHHSSERTSNPENLRLLDGDTKKYVFEQSPPQLVCHSMPQMAKSEKSVIQKFPSLWVRLCLIPFTSSTFVQYSYSPSEYACRERRECSVENTRCDSTGFAVTSSENLATEDNQVPYLAKQNKTDDWKECKKSPVNKWNEQHHSPETMQRKVSADEVPAVNLQEPDSSWPEQETCLKTSEQFMQEGKRLKHEGDSYTDSKTGRTRNGESLSRALLYFEAAVCFLMNGYMLEVEKSGERSASHSPTSMYNQTINLLDYVRKMRPHDSREETAFKRLNISCLRSQALLYLRIFKLKKEVAGKYYEAISEHFKSNKPSHFQSPWRGNQSALSPVSPAVPSPYGASIPGPSPLAATSSCDQVSSSTQVSRITSPPTQNGVLLTPKMHEMFKQYHMISGSLMQAHDKWDQAETMFADHESFFNHVDVLRGHSLNLDNSVKDLETYNKVILRQLRGAYKSPKD